MKWPQFLSDRLLRQKLNMAETPLDRYRIRLARSVDDYEGAFRLVQSAYVAIGIENVLSSTVRITPQHVLPETYVILAEERGQLVGTFTVTLDSPAGLPLDKDYLDELNAMRGEQKRMCEFGSLAVVDRCRRSGVTNLLNMAAFTIATRTLGATHVVAGVNPRAVDFFRATYNFDRLGGAKRHSQLVAPVAGLVNDLARLGEFLQRSYPKRLTTGTRPVEHFFGEPLSCIDLPVGAHDELIRWKLARDVFQEIFFRRSNRVATLDPRTHDYLAQVRTRATLDFSAFDEGTVSP